MPDHEHKQVERKGVIGIPTPPVEPIDWFEAIKEGIKGALRISKKIDPKVVEACEDNRTRQLYIGIVYGSTMWNVAWISYVLTKLGAPIMDTILELLG